MRTLLFESLIPEAKGNAERARVLLSRAEAHSLRAVSISAQGALLNKAGAEARHYVCVSCLC